MSTSSLGTALVTGASSGIGAIYADRLARRGHDLILVARDGARLDALASRLTAETGRKVEVLVADLGSAAQRVRIEQRLRQDASLTLLVNNAGIDTAAKLVEADIDQMTHLIELNVTALTRLSYAAVPGFVARGRGAVINISSIVSITPELLNGVYGGSKAFVTAFSQSLHHELSAQGLRVQAVLPGATATEFWARGGLDVGQLPKEWVMSAQDLVDAALVGYDRGELITVPSLHDEAPLLAYEAARQSMAGQLSSHTPAPRYAAA